MPILLKVESGLVNLLNQANLPVYIFQQHHVLNIHIAGVITDEDLIGWNFTSVQCAHFFQHLTRWQKMRTYLLAQNLWDELQEQIKSTGICSCKQLKQELNSSSFQCSNKEQLIKGLEHEIKHQNIMKQLKWTLKK